MAKQTKGYCKYCGKEYTKGGVLRHLPICKERKGKLDEETGKTKCGYFQVVIQGKYDKDYWLIIEINENAMLKELDKFIRDIWVECCGHLSMFEINGVRYEVCPNTDGFWGAPARSMNCKLKDVFSVGDIATYEYDFGSTTELILNLHSYGVGDQKKEKIVILSRNNPIEIICSQCGKNKAEWVDPQGFYDGNPFWCDECLHADVEEDESETFEEYYSPEFLLPVCNSPRMGVCGYKGSEIYSDQFEPDEK